VRTFSGQSPSFSSDGSRVVIASAHYEDRAAGEVKAKIFDVRTGQVIVPLHSEQSPHTDWINVTSYSPDQLSIATGSQDQTAKIWDARTGDLLLTLAENEVLI